MTQIQPYGSWKSPIASDDLAKHTLRFGQIDVEASSFYYTEGRPSEKGRVALMQGSLQGTIHELLPKEFNVRTTVHEYGGKCFLAHQGTLYFVNYQDQAIYKRSKEGSIICITNEPLRFVDFAITKEGSFLYAVAEKHVGHQVENSLVRISLIDHRIEIIASGYDFYAAPRISPNGLYITWFCWNHPHMPWDCTELWIARLSKEGLSGTCRIAGEFNESITSPLWSPTNTLYFLSDRTGYWNLYRYHLDGHIDALYSSEIEFGAPHWIFGVSRYCFFEDEKIAIIGTTRGLDSLYMLSLNPDPAKNRLELIKTPFTSLSDLYCLDNHLLFIASSPSLPSSLVSLHIKTKKTQVLKKSQENLPEEGYISFPKEIAFPTEGGLTAYGFYYPPTNQDYRADSAEKPPLIMRCHGGPTTHVSPKFNLEILYFTSRGFAFFEINYGGSTGYGRDYRNRLKGQWGIVDVQDCVHAAHNLCRRDLVDKNRLIIKGSSAGGYTALAALTFTKVFQAGVSYYGISDIENLVQETHKMELCYLDGLVGPYPEKKQMYIERSPIHFTKNLCCPTLFLQGMEDTIVPPSQSEKMYQALSKNKIPTAYILFKGESHGFRMGETLKRCVEAELFFYAKIFHFSLTEPLEAIKIDHLR